MANAEPGPGTNTPMQRRATNDPFFGLSPSASHAVPEREWRDYRELGVRSLRVHLQAAHLWHEYDQVVDRCRAERIEVLMLISYESFDGQSIEETPPWGGVRRRYTNCRDLIPVLERAATRFRDRGVRAWEIWNEPNGMWHVPAEEFGDLLCAVCERFKYGDNPWDPEATIVFGGIDAVAWFHDRGGNDHARAYVRDVFESSAFREFRSKHGRAPCDAMAIHPYGAERAGTFDYNIEHVCLETMREHGDADLPIWITELGDFNADDAVNADKLEHFVRCAHAHPSVARLHWFKYTYPGTDGHALYSLVMEDGRRRAAFGRYRNLIRLAC